MKVSIVVPTFNQGPYLRQCLRSIQEQSHRDLEVLIQDSCSTDETEVIGQEFSRQDSRFCYIREKDRGQSDALNRGLARSSGPFWTWLCSDDFYVNPQAIESLSADLERARQKDPNVMGVYGTAFETSPDGRITEAYDQLERDLIQKDFLLQWPLSQPSALLLQEAVTMCAGLNPQYRLAMDLDLFLRLLANGHKVVYSPTVVCGVRKHPESKSVKHRAETMAAALKILRKQLGSIGNPFQSEYVKLYGKARCVDLWNRWMNFGVEQDSDARSWRSKGVVMTGGWVPVRVDYKPETGTPSPGRESMEIQKNGADTYGLMPKNLQTKNAWVRIRFHLTSAKWSYAKVICPLEEVKDVQGLFAPQRQKNSVKVLIHPGDNWFELPLLSFMVRRGLKLKIEGASGESVLHSADYCLEPVPFLEWFYLYLLRLLISGFILNLVTFVSALQALIRFPERVSSR